MIYLLEDDESIRKLVIYALRSQGWEAEGFEYPSRFWEAVLRRAPELVLLDRMLPEEDGISVLGKLRARPLMEEIPIIILTAKSAEYDKVEGLDAGADDYIVKPFSVLELCARVRAVLRRKGTGTGKKEIVISELAIAPDRHEVTIKGAEVQLTNKEYSLLLELAENEGSVLSRSYLMDRVWDLGSEPENRTLDVHIRTLRAKLGSAGEYIETVRGVGYRLRGAGK